MGEFFKGWRRKAGVVTLGMACVFAAGWARSQSVLDSTVILFGQFGGIQIISRNDRCGVLTRPAVNGQNFGDRSWFSRPIKSSDEQGAFVQNRKASDWHWCWIGFEVARVHYDPLIARFSANITYVFAIPYLGSAIPLTLLSAYLLLSNPRPPKPVPEKPPEST